MREYRCPKCGSDCHVHSYISVLLSFERADLAIISAVAVVVFGAVQHFSSTSIVIFAAAASLPILIAVRRKLFCDRCEIDFVSDLKSHPQIPSNPSRK